MKWRFWAQSVALASVVVRSLNAQSRDSARVDSSRTPRLDAVVITASRRLQRVRDIPVTTEVISRAEIQRSGAPDLNALLTQSVGVQPEAGVAGNGGVRLEGLSSQHVLLLVDGQPMVGRIDGELDVSRVPVWMIDRIEVVKGPSSTLYGSSAMGGVINVITRDATVARPSMTASVEAGSQGRFNVNTSLRGGSENVRGLVGVGRREDRVQPGRADQSGARANRWDGTGKARWSSPSSGLAVDGSVFGVREDQRWQSGQLYYFSNNAQLDGRMTLTAPVGEDDRAGVTFAYSHFAHLSRQATLPEPVSDSGGRSTESLARIEATYSGVVAPGQTLDAGVDLDRDALSGERIAGGERASVSAQPYAQYTIDVGPLAVAPGARVSASDRWGTHLTPKVAMLYRLSENVAVRASAASAYRAPDFKELYITFLNSAVGYAVKGNPDLRPETSVNLSAGIQWMGARTYARAHVYRNRFSSFIESVEAPDAGGVQQFTYDNVERGVTRGVDLEGGVALGTFTVDASYGYLEARDDERHVPLLGTVPRSARVATGFRLPADLRSSITALYWSAAPVAIGTIEGAPMTRYRGAFTRVDARVGHRLVAGADGQIGVTNAFDARPVDWPGATARRWYVGISLDRGF